MYAESSTRMYGNYTAGHTRMIDNSSSLFKDNDKIKEFLNNIPDLVLMLNSRQEAVYGNQHLHEFIDQDGPREIEGRKLGDVFSCVNAKEAPGGCGTSPKCSHCGALRALNEAKKNLKTSCEYTLNRNGKDEIVFQVWAVPLYINGESFVKFILRNIGEVKQKQQLENVFLRDLSQMSAQLMAKLDYARQNPYSRDTVFDEICFLTNEVHDMIQYQQDLLAAEENRLETRLSDINSYCELQNIIRDLQPQLRRAEKDIQVSENSDKVFFQRDKRLLKRVIRHMLCNALEATPPGEHIHAECLRKENNVLFKVHNSTVIPEDVQKQLFSRSFSTKGDGRGMGTYSMKLFVEKYLNGSVSCSSSPQHGTTFVISLPLIKI